LREAEDAVSRNNLGVFGNMSYDFEVIILKLFWWN